MTTSHAWRAAHPVDARPVPTTHRTADPWLWLAGGVVLFFAVPFIGTDVLELQPDLYYLCYFTVALAWMVLFVRAHGAQLDDLWRRAWPWSLAVGALGGIAVAAVVFGSTGTDHPDGWRWWFEIGWRGIVYGVVDTSVLFVFPASAAFLVLRGDREGAARKIGFAGLALAMSLLVSTAYHLGYPEYRDADLRSPLMGTVVASMPAVLTGNPVGAFLTHPTAHVSAVVHQEEGGPTHMLPPATTGDYAARGDGDVAAALAGVWVLAAIGGVTVLVRRRRAVAQDHR